MIEELRLPLCNSEWGRRDWPFFQPTIVTQADGKNHYLGEDWAFSHRLHQIGITPLADQTFTTEASVSASIYNLAAASPHTPDPVNFALAPTERAVSTMRTLSALIL